MCPDVLHEAGIHLAQQLKDVSKLREFSDVVTEMCNDPNPQGSSLKCAEKKSQLRTGGQSTLLSIVIDDDENAQQTIPCNVSSEGVVTSSGSSTSVESDGK